MILKCTLIVIGLTFVELLKIKNPNLVIERDGIFVTTKTINKF
jgi:hypothetical protein